MGFIAQKPARLSGKQYEPGDPVPDDVANEGAGAPILVALGLIAVVPDAALAGIRTGTTATSAAFDPADHTAVEVEEFVDANPDELARVRDQEASGHGRKVLLAHLDRRLAERASDTGDEEESEGDEGGTGEAA